MYKKYFKRLFDMICSFLAIVCFFWLFIIVAVLVRINLGSPVIFKQERPGLNNKIFILYKFRTMIAQRNKNGNLLSDEERLTRFGKILRKTSLDEIPELFNILKGDMSIVGPRPQLVSDMVFMTEEQKKRHTVRPGLTGLAQINGRNNISWEEKFLYDLKYINNGITFVGDMKIILLTAVKVLKRSDTVREGTQSDIDFGDWLLKKGEVDEEEYMEKQEEAKKLLRV